MFQAVMAGIGAAGNIYGGFRANSEARKQAALAIQENENEARRMEEDTNKLISEQHLGYAKSGVILDGSPLLLIEETRQKGLQDRLQFRASGRARADAIAGEGRAKLMGAFSSGFSSMGDMKVGGSSKASASKPDTPNGRRDQGGGRYITNEAY